MGETRDTEADGFLVFGTTERRRMYGIDGSVAIVTVVRLTNKGITELGDLASLIIN